MASRRLALALCLLFLITAAPAWSQVESGRIVGTVHDISGAAVPGARVTVENTGTSIRHTVTTDATGQYVVTRLQPGTYTASVEHEGFRKIVEAPFQLTVTQVVTLDVALTVGEVRQVVTVTASEPLLESGTSSLGQVITAEPITSLPLNGRDFIQLAYLTPGVNQGPSGIVQQG